MKICGPLSVFVPSEIAFGKLHEGELIDWLKPVNKIKLTGIVNNHVVEGKIGFEEFFDGQQLKTLNGTTLEVQVSSGYVSINGAKLMRGDNEASNGVVHSMDAIILLN